MAGFITTVCIWSIILIFRMVKWWNLYDLLEKRCNGKKKKDHSHGIAPSIEFLYDFSIGFICNCQAQGFLVLQRKKRIFFFKIIIIITWNYNFVLLVMLLCIFLLQMCTTRTGRLLSVRQVGSTIKTIFTCVFILIFIFQQSYVLLEYQRMFMQWWALF